MKNLEFDRGKVILFLVLKTRELKTNCKVLSREVESAIERAEQAE